MTKVCFYCPKVITIFQIGDEAMLKKPGWLIGLGKGFGCRFEDFRFRNVSCV